MLLGKNKGVRHLFLDPFSFLVCLWSCFVQFPSEICHLNLSSHTLLHNCTVHASPILYPRSELSSISKSAHYFEDFQPAGEGRRLGCVPCPAAGGLGHFNGLKPHRARQFGGQPGIQRACDGFGGDVEVFKDPQ